MFKLLRYFSFSSAVVVIAVTTILLLFYRQNAVNDLVELAENQNIVLARSFANTIWPRFSSYAASASKLDGDTLQSRWETRQIHEALKSLTVGIPVVKIKIYNLNGLTVYSTEPEEIGVYELDNPGLVAAARKGRSASKLTYRDTLSTFERTILDRDLVESYLPIRHDEGPIEGIFELYSDVTPLIATIEQTTMELVAGFVLVFGFLYGGLLLIVQRADRILKQQYTALEDGIIEREKAREALKRSHGELEQRVEERTHDLEEEIAERKRAEEGRRRISQAVEQSPAMTIITDPAGRIEYVNPRFTAVTGYTLEEITGKTPRFLKSGEIPSETYAELWQTIKAGREWRNEVHNRKKNGELYWASMTISPVTNQNGTVTHFLGISEDITERKRAEDQARRQRSELAHAGRVNIVGEMATSLAHELNQPLTVISGCAQVCLKSLRSGDEKPHMLLDSIEQVAEQAHRANEIIHRIRGFIQKEEPVRANIDVNEAILSVADLLRSDVREHGATVSFDFAQSLPPIFADMLQIQQVILNLAHNGIEAMADNEPHRHHLTIGTCALQNGAIEVFVQDAGEGISAENLDRVFDPFFTTKNTGLGMGLSLSRSIIEAHGGRLWATSDDQTGTIFRFTMPIIDESRQDGP